MSEEISDKVYEDEEVVEVDGDAEEAPAPEPQHKTFKCRQCGAKMEFAPRRGSQKCPYCGFEHEIARSEEDIKEIDLHEFLRNAELSEEMEECKTVKCEQCGAEAKLGENIVSDSCAFCGAHIVLNEATTKHIRPRSLLPFKITGNDALEMFRKWIAGLWFAPNKLKERARTEGSVDGVYIPYWTFDSATTTFYTGQRGEYYYTTTRVNGKTRRTRHTRWYPASGTVWCDFDDVLVLASRSLPKKYADELEPWDLQDLTPFKEDYLSGFKAESYSVGLEDGFREAEGVMGDHIRALVRQDIGGDVQRVHTVKTSHDNVTFKHLLLPVWISAYRFNERVYRFLVNARTGEVQGERPWSWIKITLAVLAGAAVAGIIYVLAQS